MATTTYIGTGEIISADYKSVKFVGKTKDNEPIIVEIEDALNTSNIDLNAVEKNDTVAQMTFEGCYTNTDTVSSSNAEKWKITTESTGTPSDKIMLGAGTVFIDNAPIGLTRGGSQWTVEREYREINADGDRGAVKGRVVMESSRAKLTINALTFIDKFSDLFPAVEASV